MNGKQWAVLFICMITMDYVHSAAYNPLVPQFVGNAVPAFVPALASNLTRYRRQTEETCVVDCPKVTVIVDETLERCRGRLKERYELRDESVENNLQLVSGSAEGFSNFQRIGDVQCSCTSTLIIFHCEISYLNVVVSYTVTLLDGLLGGLLGNLGRTLARVVGSLVNTLVRILVLEIRVSMKVTQQLIAGSNCVLVDYKVKSITELSLLNLNLTSVAKLLESLLVPVLDLVLQVVMNGEIKDVFVEEFARTSIPIEYVTLPN